MRVSGISKRSDIFCCGVFCTVQADKNYRWNMTGEPSAVRTDIYGTAVRTDQFSLCLPGFVNYSEKENLILEMTIGHNLFVSTSDVINTSMSRWDHGSKIE